jgi:hypothetical protein
MAHDGALLLEFKTAIILITALDGWSFKEKEKAAEAAFSEGDGGTRSNYFFSCPIICSR